MEEIGQVPYSFAGRKIDFYKLWITENIHRFIPSKIKRKWNNKWRKYIGLYKSVKIGVLHKNLPTN